MVCDFLWWIFFLRKIIRIFIRHKILTKPLVAIPKKMNIKKILFILSFFLIQFGFSQNSNGIPISERDSIKGIYIPKDLKDSFKQINGMFNDSIKKVIKNQTEFDFTTNSHFGLGLWLRNNWGLWSGSRLYVFLNQKGLNHPDDMSSVILTSYHRHINGERIRLTRQVRYYKEYWKKSNSQKEFIARTFNNEKISDVKTALSISDSISEIELIGYEKIPRQLKKFKLVKELSIENCPDIDLKRTIKKIAKNKSIEKLSFFSNQQTEYPDNIRILQNLKSLWISGDSIKKVPTSIAELINLKELIITECENIDSYILFETIKNIKSLRELDLSDNNFKSIPENIKKLNQLKELWLDGNGLTEISNEIKSLQNLENLRMFNNRIEHLDFTKNDLINLKNIDLCYNKFEMLPIELANLPSLERVTMWHSEISEIPMDIEKLINIKFLNISNNKLTEKQIEFIKEKLPNTEIKY